MSEKVGQAKFSSGSSIGSGSFRRFGRIGSGSKRSVPLELRFKSGHLEDEFCKSWQDTPHGDAAPILTMALAAALHLSTWSSSLRFLDFGLRTAACILALLRLQRWVPHHVKAQGALTTAIVGACLTQTCIGLRNGEHVALGSAVALLLVVAQIVPRHRWAVVSSLVCGLATVVCATVNSFAIGIALALHSGVALWLRRRVELSLRVLFLERNRAFHRAHHYYALLSFMLPKPLVHRYYHRCLTQPIHPDGCPAGLRQVSMGNRKLRAGVIFAAICNFDKLVAKCSSVFLVRFLNALFSSLDKACDELPELTKVETIHEVYVAASGLFEESQEQETGIEHLKRAATLCSRMHDIAAGFEVQLRIGLHCGPLVTGVVGDSLPRFRLFGDTVNATARLEQHCPVNSILLSQQAVDALAGEFKVKEHGTMDMKGLGSVKTFLLCSEEQAFSSSGSTKKLPKRPVLFVDHEGKGLDHEDGLDEDGDHTPEKQGSDSLLRRRPCTPGVGSPSRSPSRYEVGDDPWSSPGSDTLLRKRPGRRNSCPEIGKISDSRNRSPGSPATPASSLASFSPGRSEESCPSPAGSDTMLRRRPQQMKSSLSISLERNTCVKKLPIEATTAAASLNHKPSEGSTGSGTPAPSISSSPSRMGVRKFFMELDKGLDEEQCDQGTDDSWFSLIAGAIRGGRERKHSKNVVKLLFTQIKQAISEMFHFQIFRQRHHRGGSKSPRKKPLQLDMSACANADDSTLDDVQTPSAKDSDSDRSNSSRSSREQPTLMRSKTPTNWLSADAQLNAESSSSEDTDDGGESANITREASGQGSGSMAATGAQVSSEILPRLSSELTDEQLFASVFTLKFRQAAEERAFCSLMAKESLTRNRSPALACLAVGAVILLSDGTLTSRCVVAGCFVASIVLSFVAFVDSIVPWINYTLFFVALSLSVGWAIATYNEDCSGVSTVLVPWGWVIHGLALELPFLTTMPACVIGVLLSFYGCSANAYLPPIVLLIIRFTEEKIKRHQHFVAKVQRDTQGRMQCVSEALMPPSVVHELRCALFSRTPSSGARQSSASSHEYDFVTALQADLVGFTALARTKPPEEVVCIINDIFGMFDACTKLRGIYKMETIGDAYVCVSGLPDYQKDERQQEVLSVLLLGKDMLEAVSQYAKSSALAAEVNLRVGVHSGDAVGGVVGNSMQRYHLFGQTMRIVETLEATAPTGAIHLSEVSKATIDRELEESCMAWPVELPVMPGSRELETSKGEAVDREEIDGLATYLVHPVLDELMPGESTSETGGSKQHTLFRRLSGSKPEESTF